MSWEGLNRRKFPRASFPCLIKFSKKDQDAAVMLTHTENISTGGTCIIVKRLLEPFSIIDIEIDLMDGEETVPVKGKVVWTVRRKATDAVKPSFYDIGIEFMDLNERDFERFAGIVERLVAAEKVDRGL